VSDAAVPDRLLRLGLPSKGRLAEISAQLLAEAGLNFRRSERSLFARCRDMPVEVIFLRTDDIPVLAAEGAIDLGVTGADLVAESGAALVHRLDLGIGSCRLALCVGLRSRSAVPGLRQPARQRHQVLARRHHRDRGTRAA
jgi:ATP phosphoribosyltransferase